MARKSWGNPPAWVLLFGVLFLACSSGPAPAPAPTTPPDELDAAIRETSDYLNKQLPKGNKLVILNIQSDFPAVSEYIIDELIANTVNDDVFSVVDRQQLNTIRAELDFQMSGEVDDKTAQALGRMAGAQIIVSGAVSKIGDRYRLRVRALGVQSAEIEGQFNRNIPDGSTIAALAKSQATGYGGGSSGGTTAATKPGVAPGGQTAQTPAAPPAPTYKIGGTGPAGGLIFYDKGNNNDGWRYLEAASKDAGKAAWGLDGFPVGRTNTAVGTGKANTNLIERALQSRGESGKAVQLVRQYTQGEYTDWFLPSKDELNLMYTNLEMKGLGGFTIGWYWSSSESNSAYAWAQRFSDGMFEAPQGYGDNKTHTVLVRGVRAF